MFFLQAVVTLLGCTAVLAEDNQGMVCPHIRSVESKTSVDTSRNNEISGLAISPTQVSDNGSPIFFAASDYGNGPKFGVYDSGTGKRLLMLRIKGQKNEDWESMTIGPCGDGSSKTCIYIADTGSNNRDEGDGLPYRIIKILEPIWTEHSNGDVIEAEDHLLFDYKDKSSPMPYADCEAVFVDHKGWGDGNAPGDIYLATKWGGSSAAKKYNRLFKIPARAWDKARDFVHSPKAVGEYSSDGSSDFSLHTWTSADMSLDGTLIALGTTKETHMFLRCPGESVESVLARPKSKDCGVWSNPTIGKGETFSFMPDGKSSLGIPEGDDVKMGFTFFGYDVDQSKQVCESSSTVVLTVPPIFDPTAVPPTTPTLDPSTTPTLDPTAAPSVTPSVTPSSEPSSTPSSQPSSAPSSQPSSSPSSGPSAAPTAAPTQSPTPEEGELRSSLIPLKSEIKIRVSPVSGDLATTFEVAKGFESACSRFFRMYLPSTIEQVNCILVKQALSLPHGGRNLQHQKRSVLDEMILDSTVWVSGNPTTDGYFLEDFEAALAPLLNENSDDFAAFLKMITYFSKVNSIEGYDSTQAFPEPRLVAAPTPSPAKTTQDIEDINNRFFTDTVVIIILVIGVLLVGVLLLCRMRKRSTKKELPPIAPREVSSMLEI